MKELKIFMFLLFAVLIACWAPLVFAADGMLPAHDVGSLLLPTMSADASPAKMLLWMVGAIFSFVMWMINEILPFIKSWKFNGIADFFVQGFKALVVNPTPDTMRSELDALKQTVSSINVQGNTIPEAWLNALQDVIQTATPAPVIATTAIPAAEAVTQDTAAPVAMAATAVVTDPAAQVVQAAPAVALQQVQAAPLVQGQGGFIATRLLALVAFAAIAFCFAGCAQIESAIQKDTPQSLSAKTLLSARQAVIGTAETLSTLCQQGKIDMPTCVGIQQKYLQAQIAYNTASDLESAAFAAGAAPDTLAKYQAAESQLLTLFQDFQSVGKQFNVGSGSP